MRRRPGQAGGCAPACRGLCGAQAPALLRIAPSGQQLALMEGTPRPHPSKAQANQQQQRPALAAAFILMGAGGPLFRPQQAVAGSGIPYVRQF
jgi:hypothetical protein